MSPKPKQVKITISGPAGSGKSSIAAVIEYALRQQGATVETVENTDSDPMGVVQGTFNVRNMSDRIKVVIETVRTVKP